MKKSLIKLNLTIIITLLCIVLLMLGVDFSTFDSSASTGTLGTSNTITVYNRAGRVVTDFTESSYEGGIALVSPWQITKSFVLLMIYYMKLSTHL